MALNYSLHAPSSLGNSASQSEPAPFLDRRATKGERLAHGTDSEQIDGPCEIYIVADEDCWIDCCAFEAVADPSTSTMKIVAGVPMWFSIRKGPWKIKTVLA